MLLKSCTICSLHRITILSQIMSGHPMPLSWCMMFVSILSCYLFCAMDWNRVHAFVISQVYHIPQMHLKAGRATSLSFKLWFLLMLIPPLPCGSHWNLLHIVGFIEVLPCMLMQCTRYVQLAPKLHLGIIHCPTYILCECLACNNEL